MTVETKFFPLHGGLDLVTQPIAIDPGKVRACKNYEAISEGYGLCEGYERFDGQPKPSAATYYILDFDAADAEIAEGDTVTGGNSGATGEVLVDAIVESGSYGGSDAAGYLVLDNITGTFEDDEGLEVSAVQKAVADGTPVELGADTDALNETYLQDAIATRRADIAAVPGSGSILGVNSLLGTVYAFRNNSGGTAAQMYKATSTGWVLQDLGETLTFTSGGTTEIQEEDTVTGDVSGATATVKRVIVTSGTWAGGDAAGRLIVYSVSGTFQAENLEVSAVNLATIAADAVPNTLLPDGRYEFHNFNFSGHGGDRRMYGCDGVNGGFEWDGSVFVPIITGMTTDTPIFVRAHKRHLFFAFPGGSLQNSSIGDPYEWSPITGAGEIAIGEEITGLVRNGTRTMTIFGRNTVAVLYGADTTTWDLDVLTEEAGAVAYTGQLIGNPIYLDDIGLRDLSTTQNFGDFQLGTLSRNIEPVFKSKKDGGLTPVGSCRVKSKDHYRIFYSDGSGISMHLGHGEPEFMLFELDHVVTCITAGEDASGNEQIFFGSTDGFVYQLDAGTSFDGENIDAFFRLPFYHCGQPNQHKQFRKAEVEISAAPTSNISVLADYSYSRITEPPTMPQDFTMYGGGGFWDEANWNEFYWSSQVEGKAEADVRGTGTNISLTILSDQATEGVHVFHGVTLHYSKLRVQK